MDKISDLKRVIINTLDINKALDIVSIDLKDKSSMADYMIIARGTSSRHDSRNHRFGQLHEFERGQRQRGPTAK